jgi:hypothetical protein
MYILKLNPEFNQEYHDCTFRNGVTGPVSQRTKDRMEQAYGAALRFEEWTPPVAAPAPAPKSRGRVAVPKKAAEPKPEPPKVTVTVAGVPTVSRPSASLSTESDDTED